MTKGCLNIIDKSAVVTRIAKKRSINGRNVYMKTTPRRLAVRLLSC